MVDSQTQSLLLQSNKSRGALLTARNFPIGPPSAGMQGQGRAPADCPTSKRHPYAFSKRSWKGLVGRDLARSLAHIPLWVVPEPPGALGSGALLRLAPSPTAEGRKAAGVTVMLHFWALRNRSQ